VLAAPWPTYDPAKLASGEVKLVFQVNGKLRGDAMVPVGTTEAEALKLALANEKVATFVAGKPIRRVIYISGKILNIVVEN
jgi:leucyl-tRNA synthetase